MIDLHYWTTPNGHKVTIFLEETGLPYKIFPVNIGKGEQFKREIPGDLAEQPHPRDGRSRAARRRRADRGVRVGRDAALSRRQDGKFIAEGHARPHRRRSSGCSGRWATSGRCRGRTITSATTRTDKIPYAMDRYRNEVNRLYGVLNRRLADVEFMAGEYSIADMASYPWVIDPRAPAPEDRGLPARQALARRDQGAAGGRARLREGEGGQSESGRHPHRGGARDPVRADRGVGQGGGALIQTTARALRASRDRAPEPG